MKNFIGISGSLRKDSYNTNLLKAVSKLNSGINIEMIDISNFPLFNQDLENDYPINIQIIKDKIKNSAGVIFVTPEYNRSVPGVLKNAIDWLSRPWGTSAFNDKPALIMGASDGLIGTALAQSHLKEILSFLNMRVMGQPELYISSASKKVNTVGEMTDEPSKEHLNQALNKFLEFAK